MSAPWLASPTHSPFPCRTNSLRTLLYVSVVGDAFVGELVLPSSSASKASHRPGKHPQTTTLGSLSEATNGCATLHALYPPLGAQTIDGTYNDVMRLWHLVGFC